MPKGSNSRAMALLKKVDKELQSIPKYTGEKFSSLDTRKAYNFMEATSNAITGLRRGIRLIGGAESKPSLLAKRERLQSLIQEAQAFQVQEKAKDRMSQSRAQRGEKLSREMYKQRMQKGEKLSREMFQGRMQGGSN
jgi:hypothetical protein